MATSKLELYNGALTLCSERMISALSDETEGRRLLDQAWDARAVRACLEKANWNFALRSKEIESDPSIDPQFGYAYGFAYPSDFVTIAAISSEETLNEPLLSYVDESQVWYADIDPIYVCYVSDDTDYGYDYSKWPESFTEYVKGYLAGQICVKLTSAKDLVEMLHGPVEYPRRGLIYRRLLEAKNKDAKLSPTKFPPVGSWNRSRRGARRSTNDRGNRGSLIG